MELHRTTANIAEDQSYLLHHRSFREARLIQDKRPIIISPTDEVKDAIMAWVKKDKEFRYNLDKVRNYLSYLARYSGAEEIFDHYVPPELLEGFNVTRILLSGTQINKAKETIDKKFAEEQKLLKKFYMLVKLDSME
jgi:hypothetical protein